MKKFTAILLLFAALISGCGKTQDDGTDKVYLRSFSYEVGTTTRVSTSYQYDAGNKLLSMKTVNDFGVFIDSTIYSYEYGSDGKIESAWVAGAKQAEYTRDTEGRLKTIRYFSPDGSILNEFSYSYHADHIKVVGTASGSSSLQKYFYGPDGNNIIRYELYDAQNTLTETTSFDPLPQKNPLKLVKNYFGEFSNENIMVASGSTVNVLQTFENYAVKTSISFGGPLRLETYNVGY